MRQPEISISLAVLACLSVPALPQGSSACVDTKDYYKVVAACSDVIAPFQRMPPTSGSYDKTVRLAHDQGSAALHGRSWQVRGW